MNWQIPFYDLVLGEEEKKAVSTVLSANWLTAGPKIQEFENAFAIANGYNLHASAVSSATAALHLALLALNIGQGDEVILPSLTFVACANVIRSVGATPIFADVVSLDNWNLCPVKTEEKINEKTKAIMVVHFAGYPCEMARFTEIASRFKLKVIEDCSHAPLAKVGGNFVGTIGDVGCFSFFSNKNMTTGEGGMVLSKEKELIQRISTLRSHGMTSSSYQRFKGHSFGYDVSEVGFNYRLDEIRAAIGIEQLKKLPESNMRRAKISARYREVLKQQVPDLLIPFEKFGGESVHHIFPILLPENHCQSRAAIMKQMSDYGIQCSMHYAPIHQFSAYQNLNCQLQITEQIGSRVISLPFFPTMSEAQIDIVSEALIKCLA